MNYRTDAKYANSGLMTEAQWKKKKKVPLPDTGIHLWTNGFCQQSAIYYLPSEVRDMTEEELAEMRKKAKASREDREKRKHQELIDLVETAAEEKYEEQIKELKHNFKGAILNMCQSIRGAIKAQPQTMIAFDLETTGLNPDTDEILQISIVNQDGKELFNTYVKPYFTKEWKEVEKLTGITPEMVEYAPYPHEVICELRGILESADVWVSYNGEFDLSFLRCIGIEMPAAVQHIDVMRMFAPIYGQWNHTHLSYKWKSLETCAKEFKYTFKSHNSLEDAKATMFCYNMICKNKDVWKERISALYEARDRIYAQDAQDAVASTPEDAYWHEREREAHDAQITEWENLEAMIMVHSEREKNSYGMD